MSQTIIVKSVLKDDIRRFSVNVNCSWTFFLDIISKLYDSDITTLHVTYRDEEGDDIAITSDDELLEAIRLAGGSKPPILRVLISGSGSSGNNAESRNLLHSVVQSPRVNGNEMRVMTPQKPEGYTSTSSGDPYIMVSPKNPFIMISPKEKPVVYNTTTSITTPVNPFILDSPKEKPVENMTIKPMTVDEPISTFPNMGKNCADKQKESSPRTFTFPTSSSKQVYNTIPKKEEGVSAKPLPVIYVSGKPFVPKSKLEGSTIGTQVIEQQPQKKESLVTVTNNLAESISSMVLESSDSTLQSSTIHSAAISLQTEKLSQQTGEDNYKIATQICSSTNQISARSEAGELDDNIRRSLSDACNETGKNSSKLSDEIAAITNTYSLQIAADVAPLSLHTRNLQAAATEGLEDHLTQGVDALVRDIMKATSVV
jgi:hypothetical protein